MLDESVIDIDENLVWMEKRCKDLEVQNKRVDPVWSTVCLILCSLCRTSRCSYNTKERKDMFIIVLVLVVCVIIGAITIAFSKCEKEDDSPSAKVPFENAAVASDATPCSKVGRDILESVSMKERYFYKQ